jgi:hypothetical protein
VEADGQDEATAIGAVVDFFSSTEHDSSLPEEFDLGQSPTISSPPPAQLPSATTT